MAKSKNIVLDWELKPMAAAMQATEAEMKEFFKLPGSVPDLAKTIVVKKLRGWRPAAAKGSYHDFVDDQGKLWKFGGMSAGGMRFNASRRTVPGDRFNEAGFHQKLDRTEGYVLADIPTFPKLDVYLAETKTIRRWHAERRLGPSTHVGRKKLLRMLQEEN